MTLEKSRLRSDLVISRQDSREGVNLVLKDPVSGRFFRFGEAEYYITQRLDGDTSLESIQREVEEKFGSRLSWETLARFVESLRKNGLLQEPNVAGPKAGGRRLFRGSLLYLRLTAFDPDRLLTRISRYVRFFFTPHFLALSVTLMVLAVYVAILDWGEIQRGLPGLWRFGALLLAWLALYVVTAAHEFAHGLTCKHFGGEVHEMGLLLIYFQPAFYCNVSDAWLLPKKYQRLWVTFAGAYFDLLVCAVATLVWRLVEPGTWLNSLALILMVTSAVKTFFNLNPLIKLDGYYLLSDYLEVPNLRSRSFAYLGAAVRRFLPGMSPREERPATNRERHIYLAYGLLAGAYSYWLLAMIVVGFGGFLTTRYQGLGFLLYAALLVLVFQGPITRILQGHTERVSHWGKNAGPLKRKLVAAAVTGAALAFLWFGRMELKLSSEFRILPASNAEVRAEVGGIIDEVFVDEGAAVHRGDRIARLSGKDLRAELQMTEATIAEKTEKLKMLQAGARPEEIELARRALDTAKTRRESALARFDEAKRVHGEGLSKASATSSKAKERLAYAGQYLENARQLFQGQLISRQEMDKAREQVAVRERELEEAQAEMKMILADDLAEVKRLLAVAGKELEEAQGRLTLLLAGSRPEEIEATRAEIANQEARRQHLRQQIQSMDVTSPITGVITTPKLKERIGQLIPKGELIATVQGLNTVTAEIVSPEKEIADVRVGQQVVLKARAYPDETFAGKVTSIAPIVTKEEEGPGERGERYVRVSSQIDNPEQLLKAEMTGKAKIYCGQRRVLDLLSRRMARYIRIEFWSWW